MKRTPALIISLSATAVLAAGLFYPLTQSPGTNTEPMVLDTPATTEFAPGEAGLRAYINPETGKVEVSSIPQTPAYKNLDPATREALRRDSDDLEQVVHPDGSVSVNLEGRFQNTSVAHIGKDGKTYICTDHAKHVQDILDGKTDSQPSTTPEEQ